MELKLLEPFLAALGVEIAEHFYLPSAQTETFHVLIGQDQSFVYCASHMKSFLALLEIALNARALLYLA